MRRFILASIFAVVLANAQTAGRKPYESRCAGCHGADGGGAERGPNLTESRRVRLASADTLRDFIRTGVPGGGMPAFPLPDAELDSIVSFVLALVAPAAEHPIAGDGAAGERFFFGTGNCSSCHMIKGRGGALGPDLSNVARERTAAQIDQALRKPSSARAASVRLRNGTALRGLIRNESNYDLQFQDTSGALHLLSRDEIQAVTREKSLMPSIAPTPDLMAFLTRLSGEVSGAGTPNKESGALPFPAIAHQKPGDWPTYHGQLSGNRHSPLRQIDAGNVGRLANRWIFPIPNTRLEVTPVVVDGVMYVTAPNAAYALDARNGRQIWRYTRPLTKGVIGDAASGINRGVAVLGDRVFMVTDHAHLIALDRLSGALLWDVEMADYREHYGTTSAPLVAGDLVLTGSSGGDEGARGFLDAYHASTGERAWRVWTIPKPGEPLSETWIGRAIEHGCAAPWLTGTYDADVDLVYWTTGNPCPDYNGDERKGDNLYSSSVLALERATGKLRWYFQFTPHDLHDWDAAQTPMLIDATFRGAPRKLLAQANRNGFFYLLDRLTGEFLLGQPFVKKLTWASGIAPDGRPRLLPGAEPTVQGTRACPTVEGASNWMSTAYSPSTGLFYVMALESCAVYFKSAAWFEPGKSFYGGSTRRPAGETGQKVLRAIDIQTGKVAWEVPQIGPGNTAGGALSTDGGLVFFGDDSGAFAAVDAKTGKPLWHFDASQPWKASPMTYMAGGKQYVAVAAGSSILSFTLP
jgi:alcohol dehydrogenase (cytochrome c)